MWSSLYDPFIPYDPFFSDPFFVEPTLTWQPFGVPRLVDRSGSAGGAAAASAADRRRAEQGRIQQQGASRAAGGGGGQLTTTGGGDVGIFDFNRLLNEPLNLGLEDHDREYQLHVRQPQGLRKKDLHVEVHNGVLTISGEREREKTRRGEVSYVSFQRIVTVPSNVNADAISAKYLNDGTLTIHLPKIPGTGRKRIDIMGASDQSMESKEVEASTGKGGTEDDQRKDPSAARQEYVTHETSTKTDPQQQQTTRQAEMGSTAEMR